MLIKWNILLYKYFFLEMFTATIYLVQKIFSLCFLPFPQVETYKDWANNAQWLIFKNTQVVVSFSSQERPHTE